MTTNVTPDVAVTASVDPRQADALSREALAFVADLQRTFGARRDELLARREDDRARIAAGGTLDFLEETREIREGDWLCAAPAAGLSDRRVEITGPAERKMMINAFNSGACGFMADCEDALSPTWQNVVGAQINFMDAVRGTLSVAAIDGREYALNDDIATLLVRPRGWHLDERHVLVDGAPVSGALFDLGIFLFNNAAYAAERGTGPFFYLPKTESYLEARLWAAVLAHAEDALSLSRGTARATVLIETLPAAFQMDEILYEMRAHSAGLNAGRWDYIFSAIKTFRDRPEFLTPDRAAIRMTVPFMRSYTELLVKTCHRRGAHAIGGMAALIPSRRDPEANARALAAVGADKRAEAAAGFDGTWVAHPDVVAAAMAEFDAVLLGRPNQIERQRDEVCVTAVDLLDVAATPGARTEAGLRMNINVGIQYIASWLRGVGAAAIHGLMEDAATAEISRSQIWQWVRHGATLDDGTLVSASLVRELVATELQTIRRGTGSSEGSLNDEGRYEEAAEIFITVALGENLPEFLTLVAYDAID